MIAYSGYQYHASANESFDSVARAVYGSERYAADLMDANPDLCGMTVFNGGETLRLPSLDAPQSNDEATLANTIAPWKT